MNRKGGKMRMVQDFVDDLIFSLSRVITLDATPLKEILIVSGMPESTENLRYLGFNQQRIVQDQRQFVYSAVAVINNRRAKMWRLQGYQKKISQLIFHTKWTRNPLDLFLNNLRCDDDMTDIMVRSTGNYTLFGLLHIRGTGGRGFIKRRYHCIRPVVGIPDLSPTHLQMVSAFEHHNEVKKTILGFTIVQGHIDLPSGA